MKLWTQLQSAKNGSGTDAAIKGMEIPKIIVPLADMMLMQGFVDECPDEISGLSQIGVSARGFEVMQPFILNQQVTGASTDLTEAAATFLLQLVTENRSPDPYKFWWHSHVNMSVFWSGTDEATARGFGNEFMISLVMNRRREFLTRLDMFEPFRLTIYDLPLEITVAPDPKLTEFCKKQIEEFVHSGFSLGGLFRGKKKSQSGSTEIIQLSVGKTTIEPDELTVEEKNKHGGTDGKTD